MIRDACRVIPHLKAETWAQTFDKMHHSVDENPNSNWLHTRGSWIVLLVVLFFIRLGLAIIPGISTELSWTLTNLIFNMVCNIHTDYVYNVSLVDRYSILGFRRI